MDNRAIGIFDSGLGGITAVREVKKLMPNENIIYFGDTSRVPYGTRSKETIKKYATQDIRFLLSKDVKMIIAACGTVSSNLPADVIAALEVDFTGVLLPAVQAACAATKTNRIGVIATTATVKSGAYGRAIRNILQNPKIIGKACPMFVPLVENGYTGRENPITRAIAQDYLDCMHAEKIDTLILGCTHYPILKPVIADLMGEGITLIDPGMEAARHVQALLTNRGLRNDGDNPGTCSFYVSDNVEGFAEQANVFLQEHINDQVELVDIDRY